MQGRSQGCDRALMSPWEALLLLGQGYEMPFSSRHSSSETIKKSSLLSASFRQLLSVCCMEGIVLYRQKMGRMQICVTLSQPSQLPWCSKQCILTAYHLALQELALEDARPGPCSSAHIDLLLELLKYFLTQSLACTSITCICIYLVLCVHMSVEARSALSVFLKQHSPWFSETVCPWLGFPIIIGFPIM